MSKLRVYDEAGNLIESHERAGAFWSGEVSRYRNPS